MRRRQRALRIGGVVAGLVVAVSALPATAIARTGATVLGTFADSCRDFTAASTKDISHVVLQHVHGGVVKDEWVVTPNYSIDGGPGDELEAVEVKSSTTRTTFRCTGSSAPPTASLEIETPPIVDGPYDASCATFIGGEVSPRLDCNYHDPRGVWTAWETGAVFWGFCPGFGHPYCQDFPNISFSFSFRGASSTDLDGDITSWSIDFGDGTAASGSWATDPPSAREHTYLFSDFEQRNYITLTLTVIDATGQIDTATLTLGLVAANDI